MWEKWIGNEKERSEWNETKMSEEKQNTNLIWKNKIKYGLIWQENELVFLAAVSGHLTFCSPYVIIVAFGYPPCE